VVPLYYYSRQDGTFVSLPIVRWQSGARTNYCVPPVLSWLSAEEKEKNLWLLGPLAHLSWGEQANSQHVVPLYYYSRRSGTFLSLPACRWREGSTTNWIVPPLLSGYSTDGRSSSLTALLGLAHQEWGEGSGLPHGYVFPLYAYEKNDHFYTPLFGWKKDRFVYPLTPLFGIRTGSQSGTWLLPFYSYRRDEQTGNVYGWFFPWGGYEKSGDVVESSLFPIYYHKSRGSLDNLPPLSQIPFNTEYGTQTRILLSWHRNQFVLRPSPKDVPEGVKVAGSRHYMKRNGFFPLWSYSEQSAPDENRLNVDGSCLGWLYDYTHEVKPVVAKADEKAVDDYARSRVLWHLWHYERSNEDVSVDMFPGITYDSRADGFRKYTFLYRFFRYETGKDGTKLNLLFLPILW
jgi:hypothetical protein